MTFTINTNCDDEKMICREMWNAIDQADHSPHAKSEKQKAIDTLSLKNSTHLILLEGLLVNKSVDKAWLFLQSGKGKVVKDGVDHPWPTVVDKLQIVEVLDGVQHLPQLGE